MGNVPRKEGAMHPLGESVAISTADKADNARRLPMPVALIIMALLSSALWAGVIAAVASVAR